MMRVSFKTFSDTNALFIIRGKDLSVDQKDLSAWRVEIDFSIAGPKRAMVKKNSLDLEFRVRPMVGKMPPDVTGRVREFDAEEEWVGIEVFGVADLELKDPDDKGRLDAWPIRIKMGNSRMVKLSQNVSFNWAMEGRLDVF